MLAAAWDALLPLFTSRTQPDYQLDFAHARTAPVTSAWRCPAMVRALPALALGLTAHKRSLSRGLFAPVEDESDADALFDTVVGQDAPEPAPAPNPAPPASPPNRRTRGSRWECVIRARRRHRPPARRRRSWPSRVVYPANDPVRELIIVDPFAVAGDRAREATARVAQRLLGEGATATARLIAFDAEDVGTATLETSDHQYAEMQQRWHRVFGDRLHLRFLQQSRRGNRSLHDREVRAVTRSGRTLIWDLGHGIDGVMGNRYTCNVTLTED